MELQEFLIKDFEPRESFVEQGGKIIYQGLQEVPSEGSVKVVVVDKGGSFFISIVAFSENKIFSSELLQLKAHTRGMPRNWLLSSLRMVLNDFITQVRAHLRRD